MSYSVKTIPKFEKNLKKLAKKYVSLKSEFAALVKSLKENPQQGTLIGQNCYKIRISIASKGTGKSGDARVVTNFLIAAILCTCSPSMINPKRKTSLIKNSKNYSKMFRSDHRAKAYCTI